MSETSTCVTLEVHAESPLQDILEATRAAYARIHDADNPSTSRLSIDAPDYAPHAFATVSPQAGIEVPLPLRSTFPGPVTGVTISPYVSYPDFRAAEHNFNLPPDTAKGLWLGIQHADREVKPWYQSTVLRHETADHPPYAPIDITNDILGLRTTALVDMAAALLLKPETFGHDKADDEQIISEATLLLALGREALQQPPQDDEGRETTPALQALLEWKEQVYQHDSIDRLDIQSRWVATLRGYGIHRLSKGVNAMLTAQGGGYRIKGLGRQARKAILRSGLPQLPDVRAEMIQAIAAATDEALPTAS